MERIFGSAAFSSRGSTFNPAKCLLPFPPPAGAVISAYFSVSHPITTGAAGISLFPVFPLGKCPKMGVAKLRDRYILKTSYSYCQDALGRNTNLPSCLSRLWRMPSHPTVTLLKTHSSEKANLAPWLQRSDGDLAWPVRGLHPRTL